MILKAPHGEPRAESSSRAVLRSDALRKLRNHRRVCRELKARGLSTAREAGESEDALENRLGTGLMALYRDTRSEHSFEALYEVSRAAVLQWIRSLLGRSAAQLDPAELMQDTFVNVFRYPKGFRAEHSGSFRVWVRTIAGNIVRRARADSSRFSLQALPEGLQEPVDQGCSPVLDAQLSEQRTALQAAWVIFLCHYQRAWEQLRERDQKALRLVEVEGMSYADAGQVLRVGRSNMKMIIFRSRKRIAARMRISMEACQSSEALDRGDLLSLTTDKGARTPQSAARRAGATELLSA